MNEYFTKCEASEKMGRRIRTNVDFSGVTRGTEGVVVEIYSHQYPRKNWGVIIRWDLTRKLNDGFSKTEYETYLEEITDDA